MEHGKSAYGFPWEDKNDELERVIFPKGRAGTGFERKPKRKLSAWNKFVKANSKKPRFRMRSGKLNLKKMAVAFRKSKR